MVTTVVGPSESTRRVMVDDPARIGPSRAGPTIHVFDSMGRWVGLLACVVTAVTALAGLPAPLTVVSAFLGAVGILVVGVRSRVAVGSVRNATVIADEILAADDLVEVEALIRY